MNNIYIKKIIKGKEIADYKFALIMEIDGMKRGMLFFTYQDAREVFKDIDSDYTALRRYFNLTSPSGSRSILESI